MSEKAPKTDKQTILSIDTALSGVSVGIIAANGHVVSRQIPTERGQAAILVPTIQEVIAQAQVTFKDLAAITCTIGPGSFTGLRIGLSTARTLGLALDIPVIGLNTLDVMRRHYETDQNMLIVLETKRQDFYACYYDRKGAPSSEPFAAPAELVLEKSPEGAFVVGGNCLERFQASLEAELELLDNWTQLDPILIAQMGLERFECLGNEGAPQPLYLRGADVSVSNKPQRVLEKLS